VLCAETRMADEPPAPTAESRSAENAALAASTSNYVYIRSDDYSWIPARVLEIEDGEKRAKVSVPKYRSEAAIQSDGGQKASSFETVFVELKDYANSTLMLQNVNEHGQLKEVDDMVDLAFLHEAAILYNLKARHVQGKPYTRTGDIVIACNPYQWLNGLYSTATRRHYANALVWKTGSHANTLASLDPHIYEVSAAAYRGLAIDGNDQSILVSGESGAGKTESVKICLHHIASVQEGTAGQFDIDDESDDPSASRATNTTSTTSTSPVVQRVLDSNPLLEAFGNAQTVRNDNSSRFGKYIQLQFDVEDPVNAVYAGHTMPSCVLAGSKCEVYLLEKSRVVHHEPEERTYHIFYQLLASDNAIKAEIWSGLEDTDQESFCYVGHTELNTIEGLSDQERFHKTVESLALVGVKGEKKLTLFRSIAIVLQLGNLVVEPDPEDEDSRAIITSQDELKELAELMGVESNLLESSVLIRTIEARNEEFKVPMNATQAKDSCDAFAKEIYAKTFLWLVRCINDATCAEKNYQSTPVSSGFGTIGLLDIFGFESFETNRFEQLCINYANEKLQQKFTQDIFRSVQNEYEAEGIELGEIRYDDNTDVLDLVESRSGLLAVLNEECVRPGGNDKAFVMKIEQMNKGSPSLVRQNHYDAFEFGVRHYAGEVLYNSEGFVHKNIDTLPKDLKECATKSSNIILANHMEDDSMMNASNGSSSAVAKKKAPKKAPQKKGGSRSLQKKGSALVGQTVWTKFKGQLTALMANLGKTRTRYIRCIKPNTMKQPLVMEHKSTVEQLRCAGVVAAVTISRSAFPNRLEHDTVLDRFKALWRSNAQQREARQNAQETTQDPTAQNKAMADDLLTNAMHDLETVSKDGTVIKAFVMGNTRTYFRAGALEFLEAERLKHLGFWAADIQRIVRGFCKRRIYKRLRALAVVLASFFRQRRATKQYQEMRAAATILENWVRRISSKQTLIALRRNHNATRIQAMWKMTMIRPAFNKQRKAAVVIQAIARGAIQRPKYRVALHQFKEDQKLENQVRALQRKLEEAEERRLEAERLAEEKARKAVEEYREEKKEIESASPARSKTDENEKPGEAKLESAVSSGAANAAAAEPDSPTPQLTMQQQALIDESGKMLEYMRKEVFKLRGQNAQLRRDFDLLKDNNQRLMDANASAGASFAALNQHAKHLTKVNENLTQEVFQIRQGAQKTAVAQTELKEELKMKHATYVAEIHSRIQYQKAMNKVVEMVEQRCRDTRLVEDVLMVADECESNYSNEPGVSRRGGEGSSGSPGASLFSSPSRGGESSLMSSFRSFWS